MMASLDENETFADRLDRVYARIAAACGRVGRDPGEVTLVAIAKHFGPDAVREAADAGVSVIGENRVQEARQKIPMCPSSLQWHLVGHLQSNKVREAVRLFEMIHAVDSLPLLESIAVACDEAGRNLRVCLQVNISGEGSKYGMAPHEVSGILEQCTRFVRLDVVGLMTIPPFTPDPEAVRPVLRELRELRDVCRDETGFALEELSMGMSGDLEVAVEEGATMVRVGSSLFGSRRG